MSASNSEKLIPLATSRSPNPQLAKVIEHLVHEGKLDDVQNILMNIGKKMRLGIASVKCDQEDVDLEKKLHKSEKEREELNVKITKLTEEKTELNDRVNEKDRIICELKHNVTEKDQILNVYEDKIKFFDLRVTRMNMELYKLWEKRSEAEETNEAMRSKLAESRQIEERLRRKLIDSGQTLKEAVRESFETKLAMERMKRKLPETEESVEEIKRKKIEACRAVDKLSRQNLEANIVIEKLRSEKLEAEKVLDVQKKWFKNLVPIIKNVGEELGSFLKEKKVPDEVVEKMSATGCGEDGKRL